MFSPILLNRILNCQLVLLISYKKPANRKINCNWHHYSKKEDILNKHKIATIHANYKPNPNALNAHKY
jgi:hypothetical protein